MTMIHTHESDLADLHHPTVKLRYRLHDCEDWQERAISFEQFFGGQVDDPDDLFHDVDWIPRHASVELLPEIDTTDVAVIEVSFEADEGQRLNIKETFWNHGRSRIIEVMQQTSVDAEPYWEVLVDLRRETGCETYELIRLGRERGAVVPLHHAVTHARPDGSTQDLQIFPSR